MTERRVSVRLAATGGQQLKAELVEIGQAGSRALDTIGPAANAASHGLDGVGQSSRAALQQMDALAARATRIASIMRATGMHDGSIMDRVNAATGVNSAVARSQTDIDAYGQALDDVRAKYNPLYAEIQRYRDVLGEIRQAHATGAISADEMAQAISRERQASLASIAALKGRTGAIDQVSRASRRAALRLTQLGYQFNDVGVSIAGGMNPFVVLAQQGTQIAQIYGDGQGGVRQAFRDTGSMIAGVVGRFPLLTAAIAVGTLAIFGMRDAINETSDMTVTMGDTALAVWQVISEGLWDILKPAVDAIAPWFEAAWNAVVDITVLAGNALINATLVTADGIATTIGVLPGVFESVFALAGAAALSKLHDMLWYAGEALNKFARMVNDTFGANLNTANFETQLSWLSDKSGVLSRAGHDAQTAGQDAIGDFFARAQAQLDEDPLGGFFDAVSARAGDNARRRREEEEKGKGGKGRGGRSRKSPAEKELEEVEELETGWAAVLGKLDEYWKEAQDIGPAVGDVLVSTFKSAEDALGDFLKTGKFGFRDLIDSFLIDIAKLSFRQNILGPLAKSLSGGLDTLIGGGLNILFPLNSTGTGTLGLPSFDGGGYTGNGPRAGGLDGRGGFLAMLHPDEDVVDRTRGRRGVRAAPIINISLNGAAGNSEIRSMITAGVQEGLRTYDRQQLPQSVDRVSRRPRVNAG